MLARIALDLWIFWSKLLRQLPFLTQAQFNERKLGTMLLPGGAFDASTSSQSSANNDCS